MEDVFLIKSISKERIKNSAHAMCCVEKKEENKRRWETTQSIGYAFHFHVSSPLLLEIILKTHHYLVTYDDEDALFSRAKENGR